MSNNAYYTLQPHYEFKCGSVENFKINWRLLLHFNIQPLLLATVNFLAVAVKTAAAIPYILTNIRLYITYANIFSKKFNYEFKIHNNQICLHLKFRELYMSSYICISIAATTN